MRQAKVIVITAMLTLLALGTIVYSSCRKDHCKTLNCQNGGTCSDGFCYCPNGYTGTYCQIANVSLIDMRNETFTRVTLLIGGVEYTVDTGTFITFTGSYGDTLKGTAKTRGLYGMNVQLAPFKIIFPARGTTTHNLNVGSDYFFLMAKHTNPTVPEITKVYVNYKQRDSTLDIVTTPTTIKYNTNVTYHIGYYRAYSDTKVRLELTPSKYWQYNALGATLTENQSFVAPIP